MQTRILDKKQRLINERQAAEILGVGQESLRKWRYAGLIGFVRVGKRRPMFTPEHIERFILASEIVPTGWKGRKPKPRR